MILETDLGEYDVFEGNLVPLDCPMQEINEEEDKPIGKPKKGKAKKFYVYVKDGDKVKKVTFADTSGLSVKFKDLKARHLMSQDIIVILQTIKLHQLLVL